MKNILLMTAASAAFLGAVFMPASAHAEGGFQAGDILVRGRAIAMIPAESSTTNVAGGKVGVGNDFMPEVDVSYFFTPNIAAELIAATTKHSLSGKGTLTGTDIGDAWIVPPTVTVQYHFQPDMAFKPYVGAGVNYSFFFNEKPSNAFNKLEMTGGLGWALQAGFDYDMGNNWYLNMDVKKVFLNVDASINSGAVTADVDLDPWDVGIGIGYKF